jgi:hypothetical protein
MRQLLGVIVVGVLALEQSPVRVDAPAEATGRVIVRGDEQIATRRVDGRFEIFLRRRSPDGWGEPRVIVSAPPGTAAFASALSADGRLLLFESNQRVPADPSREDTDLWLIERDGDSWHAPRAVGGACATPANEHAPSIATDGTVCLNSARPGGAGENDIYCASSLAAAPVPIAAINSPMEDAFASIAPGGDTIVFASNREGGLGGWDLYAARRVDGVWRAPMNLGAPINSPADELHPWLDGEALYFVRPGPPRELLVQARWRPGG